MVWSHDSHVVAKVIESHVMAEAVGNHYSHIVADVVGSHDNHVMAEAVGSHVSHVVAEVVGSHDSQVVVEWFGVTTVRSWLSGGSHVSHVVAEVVGSHVSHVVAEVVGSQLGDLCSSGHRSDRIHAARGEQTAVVCYIKLAPLTTGHLRRPDESLALRCLSVPL